MDVELVNSTPDLEALRREWEDLEQRDPHAPYYVHHRFVSAWWHAMEPHGDELHVLVVRNGGRAAGIAPLVVRTARRKGAVTRSLRFASQGDYLDFLVDPSERADSVCKAVFTHLQEHPAWDTIALTNVPAISRLAGYAFRSPEYNPLFKVHVENPYIDLGQYDDFEDFCSRSLPSKTRKYRNKLLREQDVSFRVWRGDEEGILGRMAGLHRAEQAHLTEQKGRRGRVSLFDDPHRYDHVRRVFRETDDAITFGYETSRGDLVGYRTCFRHGRNLLSWNSAYAPAFDQYRLGKVLQYDLLAHQFETGDADVFDFGAGRYPWKFEWTGSFTVTYRLDVRSLETPGSGEGPATATSDRPRLGAPRSRHRPAQAPVSTDGNARVAATAAERVRPVRRRVIAALGRGRSGIERHLLPPIVWYVPHPDDESIFMGGSIAARPHRRNLLVVLTRGGGSGAFSLVNEKLPSPLTREEFMRGRLRELDAARSALGVRAEDVWQRDLPDGGLTPDSVLEVIREVARRHPRAQHRTLSYLDPHRDHRAAGEALAAAHREGTVDRCLFHLPVPLVDEAWGRPVTLDDDAVEAKRAALRAYRRWAPKRGRYAIGRHSVAPLIRHQLRQPTERVHEPGYEPPRDAGRSRRHTP